MSKQSESVHSQPLPTDPDYEGPLAKTHTARTLAILKKGGWYTVQDLAPLINATETAASSALRDLRKPKYGQHNIFRRRLENNISQYRLFEDGYIPSTEELTVKPEVSSEPSASGTLQLDLGLSTKQRSQRDPG